MNVTRQLRLQGLSHPDFFVRSRMLTIFSDDRDPGTDATAAAIDQMNRRGPKDAYEWPYQITKLALDQKSVEWVLEKTDSERSREPFMNLTAHLSLWLQDAPIEFISENLEAVEERLLYLSHSPANSLLPGSPLAILQERLEWQSLTYPQCLERLEKIFDECMEGDKFPHSPIRRVEYLCQRLAQLGDDDLRKKVATWLETDTEEDSDREGWQAGIAIQLAGLLKMTETVPTLIHMFDENWDWWNECIPKALNAMGDEKMLDLVLDAYPKLDWHARLYLIAVLENTRWPKMEDRVASLLENEKDAMLRLGIGSALALYGTPSSMKKAREIYYEDPDDVNYFRIPEILYANHCLLGTGDPSELADWKDQMDESFIRRTQKREKAGAYPFEEEADPEENDLPTLPIHNPHRDLGRNDPCPCGSGKKYKKCCLP